MSTLRDFIAGRKAEIETQARALLKELAEITHVERALEDASTGEEAPRAPGVKSSSNLKAMTLEVLRAAPDGMAADGIQDAIECRYGIEVSAGGLSSLLSRLREEETLTRSGIVWSLASSADGWTHETGSTLVEAARALN